MSVSCASSSAGADQPAGGKSPAAVRSLVARGRQQLVHEALKADMIVDRDDVPDAPQDVAGRTLVDLSAAGLRVVLGAADLAERRVLEVHGREEVTLPASQAGPRSRHSPWDAHSSVMFLFQGLQSGGRHRRARRSSRRMRSGFMGFTLVCFMRPCLPLHARVLLFAANVGGGKRIRPPMWSVEVRARGWPARPATPVRVPIMAFRCRG